MQFYCPSHRVELKAASSALACPHGCTYQVVEDIPRFVPSEAYAEAFGLQWRRFRKTQLDSYTGTTVSRDRLVRCLGGDLKVIEGRSVLEAGCGAGRFTEILSAVEADILSCDISLAVEAAMINRSERKVLPGEGRVTICQASILALPVLPQSFDYVVCLGVIQHTPDPATTIRALADCVKPGGTLVIDHYSREYDYPLPRQILRTVMLKFPPGLASRISIALSRALCFFHQLLWHQNTIAWRLRRLLRKVSPLVDYYDSYPQLPKSILGDWCVLDTHDTVTDVYKHLRSLDEVVADVRAAGLSVVAAAAGGNGVEIRATRAADPPQMSESAL